MMLHEVADAISSDNTNQHTVYKCSSPNCSGFSYSSGVACTVCHQPITAISEFDDAMSRETRVEKLGAKRRILEQSKIPFSHSSISFPMVVLSLGKAGVFDARQKPCVIDSRSISLSVYVSGIWTQISIKADQVNHIMFCEGIQVIFIRPTALLMHYLYEKLRIPVGNQSPEDEKGWIILVLKDVPNMRSIPETSRAAVCLTVSQFEVFCSSVRLSGGHCQMELTFSLAQKLLTASGVKLSRTNPDESSGTMLKYTPNLGNYRKPLGFTLLSPKHIQRLSSQADVKSTCGNQSFSSSDAVSSDNSLITNSAPSISRGIDDPTQHVSNTSDDLVILTDDGAANPISNNTSVHNTVHSSNEFVYRPPGSSDGILLTDDDVACLTPGSFLNDTIINFYLKYLFFEQLSDFQRHATHLFNCFFYSRLSAAPNPRFSNDPTYSSGDGSSGDNAHLAHHSNVAKWTRRVDLFFKDYIIIPINENSHWFLGLVCYPWMAGMVSYTKLYEAFAYDLCKLNSSFTDVDSLHFGSADISEEQLSINPNDTKGEAFDRWRRRRLAWLRRRGINAMPCILLFDSIPSQSRVGNLHVIRNYLQAEWDIRRSERDGPLLFNKDTIRGFSPRVPSQSNLVDCGIFLLHYVEMFFKKPVKSYTKDYFQNEMSSWFCSETLGQKRSVILNIIHQLRKRASAAELSSSLTS